jgi:hypothetical protein
MNKLSIIDLEKNNLGISENKSYVYYLNAGVIKQKNCKRIYLKSKKSTDQLKLTLSNSLWKQYGKLLPLDLEIFNLRNDKNLYISKIINILKLKKILKKNNFSKINLITDNEDTASIFRSFNKKIKIQKIQSRKKKFQFNHYISIIKFYIKSLILCIFIKLNSQKKLISNLNKRKKDIFLTIYPNFFKKKKETFFNTYRQTNKSSYLNLLITDETHMNFSLVELFKIYFSTKKEILHLESYLNIQSVLKSFIDAVKFFNIYKKIMSKKFIINNVDFSFFFKKSLEISLINRSKLFLYSSAIKKFYELSKFENIHLYLFEYNFGFFLTNEFRKYNSEITGYQHGVFSKNLMWLDVISKQKKFFLPDLIISNHFRSYNLYKKKLTINSENISLNQRQVSQLSKKLS